MHRFKNFVSRQLLESVLLSIYCLFIASCSVEPSNVRTTDQSLNSSSGDQQGYSDQASDDYYDDQNKTQAADGNEDIAEQPGEFIDELMAPESENDGMTEDNMNQNGPVNTLKNPGFDDGIDSWRFHPSDGTADISFEVDMSDSVAARVFIASKTSNIQLYQRDVALKPNANYIIKFDAYSESGHDLKVAVFQDVSPYADYGLKTRETIDLTTLRKTYEVNFSTAGFISTAVSDARLMFWFADDSVDGDVYWIDNVHLSETVK